jgi:hypothetical protein
LIGKSEGNQSLKRLRTDWDDNIKTDFKETGY